jgi:8-oxo-dGTP pyrophosphatase MutT (NUDIX family)
VVALQLTDDAVRAAATVVLLRDGTDGPETFLLRRVASMAFAPRMHVFPGGRVDSVDAENPVALPADADVPTLAGRASTDEPGVRALYACAVRETAEEAGIALAVPDASGVPVVDPRRLPIVGHWVTPEGESRRYDVRFFAYVVDDGQARLTTTEADHARWIRPADALDEFAAGGLRMLPPTESVLRQLVGYERAADALAALAATVVRPLLPRRRPDGSAWDLVDAYTGEVLRAGVDRPHTRETDGRPAETST